jgi:hypothetical protein
MTNAGSTKSPVRRKSPFGKSNIHRTESGNIVHGAFTPLIDIEPFVWGTHSGAPIRIMTENDE